MATLISVVVPACNAQDFLAAALSSVAAQRGPFEIEVVVVDDGSTDATAGVARRHAGVACLQQPNRGPAAARNAGIAATRGEFVAFLDADDLWPPGKLAAQLAVLQRHPQAALVFGDCRQFGAGGPWPKTQFEADGLGANTWTTGDIVPDAYRRLLGENFITTGSVLVRRSVLAAVGGFAEDLRLVEDLELWLRIARAHAIAWCDTVCLLRRRHAANASRDAEAMALAYLEVLRRQIPSAGGAVEGDDGPGKPRLLALQADEHLHLASLALSRGAAAAARQRAWRSIKCRFGWRAAWLLCRTTIMLAGQRLAAWRR